MIYSEIQPRGITNVWWAKTDTPLVSIDCCTYNHEKYIADAIEGFLMQQTTFPVEILIHDDASPDRTADIVREYEAKYPQLIKAIYQTENQYSKRDGTIGRIQRGRAKGKFTAICEGDDYWTDPLKLQKQVEFLEANPDFSICAHNALIHYEDGEKEDSLFNPTDQKPIINTEDLIRKWSFATASIVVRRSMMKRHDDDPNLKKVYHGDLFLALMMSLEGPIYFMNDVMSVYLKNNLHRYKGKWILIANKRIQLLEEFDKTTLGQYSGLIKKKIKQLRMTIWSHKVKKICPIIKYFRIRFVYRVLMDRLSKYL
jgi:glycosyltransferase involved in cell wall biosynthesis